MRIELDAGKRIELAEGDITSERTDAVVNAANSALMAGSGVDGAIRRAGGPEIDAACAAIRRKEGPLETGQAVATTAGQLPARHVIHTVGPVYRGGDEGEAALLARAYQNALRVADELGLASISFPAISTGVYGYPVEEAASVAIRAVGEALPGCRSVSLARFVLFDRGSLDAYEEAARQVFPELQ
jgi:O-acetyl-ADP-ribose deacetylase (regulator of RNase III)